MDYLGNTLKVSIEDDEENGGSHRKRPSVKAVIFSLREKKWNYRGEGNANVVIALPQERKVIRFRKCNGAGLYSPRESATFFLETRFCLQVMIPLLGACYVKPPCVISIDPLEVLDLQSQLAGQRPVSRCHKVIQSSIAAIYMDYTLLPKTLCSDSSRSQRYSTFCVEIKPKQGWVPEADRQFHKCGFCLQQFLKVKTGKVNSFSHYCPLDLFSGDPRRMRKALRGLFETPQNNLKIFQDGNLVYGQGVNGNIFSILKDWIGGPVNSDDSNKLLDKFNFVILEALLCDMSSIQDTCEVVIKDLANCDRFIENGNSCHIKESLDTIYIEPSVSSDEGCSNGFVDVITERIPVDLFRTAKEISMQSYEIRKENPCQWENMLLPKNCVLQRILSVQKLNKVGADSTYKSYHQERSLVGTSSNFSYIPSLMEPTCILSPIARYLLATTAKDCSIMLTFQEDFDNRCKPHQKQHMLQCPDGQRFIFDVSVIDLEPKPLSCIEKHAKRDYDIYSAFVDWHL